MRAWLFQDSRQRRKHGPKAPWSVGWIDPDGRRRSKRIGSKSQAEKFRRKIEGQLAAGTYEKESRKQWKDFRKEYETKIVSLLAPKTRPAIHAVLNHFERICKPQRVSAIKTAMIDEFIGCRQTDPGRKPKSTVAAATINHDLRHLKAALRVANDWGYLPQVPKFRRIREPDKIGSVVTPEHFKAIYEACDVATMPQGLSCEPAEWWRALLVFALTTGWRIDEILSFHRDDLDPKTGAILTRAGDNKGNRDDMDHLPDVALEHVRAIVGFQPLVFFWPHNTRTLWCEFARIQQEAGIHPSCRDDREHECTRKSLCGKCPPKDSNLQPSD